MAFKDKEAQRAYHKQWYQKNKARRKELSKANRARVKTLYREYKETLSCALCPEDDACCLDFHHPNDDKKHDISTMVCDAFSWDKIMEEIQKCVVLCKNCHAKVHVGHARVV